MNKENTSSHTIILETLGSTAGELCGRLKNRFLRKVGDVRITDDRLDLMIWDMRTLVRKLILENGKHEFTMLDFKSYFAIHRNMVSVCKLVKLIDIVVDDVGMCLKNSPDDFEALFVTWMTVNDDMDPRILLQWLLVELGYDYHGYISVTVNAEEIVSDLYKGSDEIV